MYFTLHLGLTLTSISNAVTETALVIAGTPTVGETVYVVNPTSVFIITDLGLVITDGEDQLGFGALPNSYQWKINGIEIEGATNVTFVIPAGTAIGSTIQCNNSNILTVI